jgi:thiaminase
MAVQESDIEKKLTREECWKMVNEAVDAALKLAHERIFSHPFTQELKAGTLPLECSI